ncbi:MAG: LPXTG cell wall anchor domain-containing protein [Clostridia bacterium]|nr:LPXTG cell wall anchor domain-containing protein [Clostridia bacterium]
MKRAILFILWAVILIALCNTAVFSHTVPDLERSGSISVTMRYGEKTVSGGTMAIYRVADVTVDNGNYGFTPCGEFASFNGDMTKADTDELAFSVAAYIADNDIMAMTMPIDSKGRVAFYDLEPGLYMLIQTVAANGYNCANPFLVSVPMFDGEEYIYDIDASAKVELTKYSNDPHEDTTPDSGHNTTSPDKGDKLPQTGQLNWPIPILLVSGTALILAGLILCFSKRKEKHEK